MEKYGLLFESIFKRKLTDGDTPAYLENITKEHPYFSVAQFYLLRLSQKNVNGYKTQARKTAVLFNNNHWLNFQLLEAGFDKDASPENDTAPQSFPEKIADDVLAAKAGQVNTEETYAPVPARFETAIEEEPTAVVKEETTIEEAPASDWVKAEESGVEEPVAINEPVIAGDDNTVEEVIVEEFVNDEAVKAEEPVAENDVITIDEVVVDEPEHTVEATAAAADEAVAETAGEKPAENPAITHALITADTMLPIAEVENKAAVDNTAIANEPLLFEPLHTTDYFASVGIKLSEEEKTSGNLGKQLKSFTEWLKTMKKVHAEQLAKTSGPSDVNLSAAESSIRKMAEKSNQENDVLTEAMAEVLLQQGKADKAVEILEKLSLLNPGKSVYFAAKINQIKEK